MSYIVAHRGNGSKYKENTINAILEVINYSYVDGIEIDVRMTKDKKFILSHNNYFITKDNNIKKISNMTYKEIKKYKNFTLLEDVLKKINTNKFILLDLKIKNKNTYRKNLMRMIKKYYNKYYLCSFDYEFILDLKKRYPYYKIGYLKGYLINNKKDKSILDFVFSHYIEYKNEEGVWTVNRSEDINKFKNKNIFIITDKPELF